MEQEKINIAALLKDCPKGTKLYSPAYGEVELLEETIDMSIMVADKYGTKFFFNFHGGISSHGECLLFPSKDVRDWGCFRVKYAFGSPDKQEKVLELLKSNGGKEYSSVDYSELNESETILYINSLTGFIEYANAYDEKVFKYILSTGTELKLEEEQPKFKVGDVIVRHDGIMADMLMVSEDELIGEATGHNITISEINKPTAYHYTPATSEEIDKWNEDTLHPNHLHYSKSKRKIIHWFLPFDRVVVKNKGMKWHVDFFDLYDKEDECKHYCCVGRVCSQCLPYNSYTAKLIGTTNDYKEDE